MISGNSCSFSSVEIVNTCLQRRQADVETVAQDIFGSGQRPGRVYLCEFMAHFFCRKLPRVEHRQATSAAGNSTTAAAITNSPTPPAPLAQGGAVRIDPF